MGPQLPAQSIVHVLFFFRYECSHCQAILQEVIPPLEQQYGSHLDIRKLEVGNPEYYELLTSVEAFFQVPADERGLPTLVIGDHILIGEDQIRDQFPGAIENGLASGGVGWPQMEGLEASLLINSPLTLAETEQCEAASTSSCALSAPIYAAFFYQVGCQECSRAEATLEYLQGKYPQLIIEKFNIYDQTGLGQWLAERVGRSDFHSPALFIGEHAWIGEAEISAQSILPVLQGYSAEGSPRIWEGYNPQAGSGNVASDFRSMSWLTVVFAGLADGINPCAFATMIFFISYLAISGRKGKEILLVGSTFAVGVFLAYLAVGFGFYKVLDLLGGWLQVVSRWVYAFTALFCFVLAVVSFLDYLKARKGNLKDMSLNLPEKLRLRINAAIRKNRNVSGYAVGAFLTGIVIAFLELACTGQVYLPTIIFVSSMPELRLRASGYLVLYNLLFITPLVVVFILAYLGTTSRQLGKFLEKNAAWVKLFLAVLFIALASWLIISLL
jgi:cytochrome c biogenesis protein CcdA